MIETATSHKGLGFPECPCKERLCTIHYWYDVVKMRRVYQHGDNEEHRLFVDDIVIWRDGSAERAFQEWSTCLHEWEDAGLRTDASAPDEEFERLVAKFERH